MDHEYFMRRAIAVAAARVGQTCDNPAVGCVLVRAGEVIAEAATGVAGRPHAEELALAMGDAKGAIAYVTLEPCGARSSGGMSCAERLARAGVSQVFIAAHDTSPFASGRGEEILIRNGVTVYWGLLESEAERLYAAYSHAPKIGMD
jgi:diaminohydroxyphosphoribosylaminopyrimidine deaminase/5-amino-6-(5-phosphoribosylamino)uracil reductase